MSTSRRVLIPFDLPDAEPVPSILVEPLATTEVVALGHYELPEQTPPGAAREQFERDTREELADLEDECDLLVVGDPDHSRALQVLEPCLTEMTLDTDDPAFVIRSPDRT